MKKMIKNLMLVAVAAMGFVACQDGVDEVVVKPQNTVSVEFTASFDETRSQFGEKVENSGYPSSWSGGEQIMLSLNEATPVIAQVESEGATANFTATLTDDNNTDDNNTEGVIYAFSPLGTYDSSTKISTAGFTGINKTYKDAYVYVLENQKPLANSCDEGAHLLAAKYLYTGGIPSSVELTFVPVAAFGKMTITDFEGEIASVSLTASKAIAGNAYYYYNDEATEENPNLKASGSAKTITLDATNVENNVFWFGCIPANLSGGSLKVVITDTEENTYTKNIDLTGKELAFKQGRVANFAVSFKDIPVDEIVDDTVNIPNGQYAIIAFNANKTVYSAMTTTTTPTTSSTVRMSSVDVVFDVNAESGFTTTDSSLVWNITNVDGGFTFTNNEGEYLSWTTGNSAIFGSTENVLTITKSEAEGTYNVALKDTPDRYLQKNSSEKYFAFYASVQRKDLYIVPVTVVEDTAPSLSVSQDSVELPYTESTGNIDVTIKNLSVDEIKVVSSADWLAAQLTTDGLNYNAEANEGEERSATVTLTAGNLTATIKFTQAALSTGGDTIILIDEEFDNTTTADSSTAITESKFPNFSGATEKAYTSKYGGIKLGTSSVVGYITSKSLDLSKAFTVTLDACKYGSDTGNIVVTVDGVEKTIANSELDAAGSFKTFTLTFDAATATSTVKIATSSKRAYIDNVKIATAK